MSPQSIRKGVSFAPATIALGYWGIARGVIIEPPAFLINAVNAVMEGLARRTAAPAAGPAQ